MLDAGIRGANDHEVGTQRLWALARGLQPWDVVVESVEQLEAGLGGARSACVQLAAGDDRAIRDTVAALRAAMTEHWAVVVPIVHLPTRDVGGLARDVDLYLLDSRSGKLVALRSSNPGVVAAFLGSGWTDIRAGALLVSSPDAIGVA